MRGFFFQNTLQLFLLPQLNATQSSERGCSGVRGWEGAGTAWQDGTHGEGLHTSGSRHGPARSLFQRLHGVMVIPLITFSLFFFLLLGFLASFRIDGCLHAYGISIPFPLFYPLIDFPLPFPLPVLTTKQQQRLQFVSPLPLSPGQRAASGTAAPECPCRRLPWAGWAWGHRGLKLCLLRPQDPYIDRLLLLGVFRSSGG